MAQMQLLYLHYSGYGELDCYGMRENVKKVSGLGDDSSYVGGNISCWKTSLGRCWKRFKAMGFNRVYKPGNSIEAETTEDLKKDLNICLIPEVTNKQQIENKGCTEH